MGVVATPDSFVPVSGSTCTFRATLQGRSRKRNSNASVRPVPYGNGAIIQQGGRFLKIYTYKCFITDAGQLTNFEQAVNQQGTLNIPGESISATALLNDIDSTTYIPNAGQYVTAEFWMDSD